MKYIINGNTLNECQIFGIQRNTMNLLCELDNIAGINNKIEVIIPQEKELRIKFKNIKITMIPTTKCKILRNFLWNQWVFPKYVKSSNGIGIDLLLALPMKGCKVVAIYDCITELFPENCETIKQKMKRFFYLLKVKMAIRNAELIITDSECAKEDLVKFYHIDPEKVQVIYCAWQHFDKIKDDDKILHKLRLKKKEYCFSLGSQYKHKNFKWIYEAAKKNLNVKFVVSGTERFGKRNSDDEEISNLIFTGYLDDISVKALMKNCKVFIQPSLYEGFGIPPLEAMSVGARCIVSNTSSLPEIYGKSVWYINPTDYDNVNLEEIMDVNIEDNDKILSKFSWEKSAYNLYGLLKRLYHNE